MATKPSTETPKPRKPTEAVLRQVSVFIDGRQHRELRQRSLDQERHMSELIREAISGYLAGGKRAG